MCTGGYELPAGALTPDTVKTLATQLQDGERLRTGSLKRLLDEGQAILATCPNITLIPGYMYVCTSTHHVHISYIYHIYHIYQIQSYMKGTMSWQLVLTSPSFWVVVMI